MIDTVILSVPMEKVRMLEPIASGTLPWNLQAERTGYRKFVKKPSERELATGLYFPVITLYHRKDGSLVGTKDMHIQLSAPKLLYHNNLDELTESDFEKVLVELADRLRRMGIIVGLQALRDAMVRAVHYSKNIEIEGGFTAQYVISELGKINAGKRFDLTKARYINDGQSLCIYATSHSFILYDKIADLAKGRRRAIDKTQTTYQMGLFERLHDLREVLRLEVRLSEKRKMNALFKQLSFGPNPTFREVFSLEKSQKVLAHYWDTMLDGNARALFTPSSTPKDLLKQIRVVRKGAKNGTAVYLTGLLLLARDGNGLRELRSILAKGSSDRSWYRLMADLRAIEADLGGFKPRDWYDQTKKALLSYQPIRIDRS